MHAGGEQRDHEGAFCEEGRKVSVDPGTEEGPGACAGRSELHRESRDRKRNSTAEAAAERGDCAEIYRAAAACGREDGTIAADIAAARDDAAAADGEQTGIQAAGADRAERGAGETGNGPAAADDSAAAEESADSASGLKAGCNDGSAAETCSSGNAAAKTRADRTETGKTDSGGSCTAEDFRTARQDRESADRCTAAEAGIRGNAAETGSACSETCSTVCA